MELLNKHKHGSPQGAVYIGRGSPLGNPYVIGKHGVRDEVIVKYRPWLKEQIVKRNPEVLDALRALNENSKLLCFCVPANCHGSVIQEIWYEIIKLGSGSFEEGLDKYISNNNVTTTRKFELHPKEDGLTHINIYSSAETRLGRLLSNFAHTPFEHPQYGKFASIEGFWFWMSSGKVHNTLRTKYGFDAKKLGHSLERVENKEFRDEIRYALRYKLEQHLEILAEFKNSSLPFSHYYYYGTKENPKVIQRPQDDWIVQFFECLRRTYHPSAKRIIIAGSRGITDYELLWELFAKHRLAAKEIVSGGARGPDTLGEKLGLTLGIAVSEFHADWHGLGKKAGFVRNAKMAEYGDVLLALWDGESNGTRNMISLMGKEDKPYFVEIIKTNKKEDQVKT